MILVFCLGTVVSPKSLYWTTYMDKFQNSCIQYQIIQTIGDNSGIQRSLRNEYNSSVFQRISGITLGFIPIFHLFKGLLKQLDSYQAQLHFLSYRSPVMAFFKILCSFKMKQEEKTVFAHDPDCSVKKKKFSCCFLIGTICYSLSFLRRKKVLYCGLGVIYKQHEKLEL